MREDRSLATDLTTEYTGAMHSTTLVDILRWRATRQADRRAYTFLVDGETEEISITYAELDKQARAIAAVLQASTSMGERALLLYPAGLDYIAAFMGCLYAGIVAVPAYPPSSNRSLARIQTIAADADTRLVLTTQQLEAKIQRWSESLPELNAMRWIATDGRSEQREDEWQPCKITPEMLTFLQYTSGSTGAPKGVMVSHANLMHNSAMMYERWGHSAESVGISWLPIFHDMGLIAGVLQPLYGGFPAVLMAPATFIQRPIRWLQAISRWYGTTSWAPNFAYELCVRRVTAEDLARLDLSSWKVAGNGAEPVRVETIERFVEVFASCGLRPETITPGYGLAEGTLMVSSSSMGVPPTFVHMDKEALEQHSVVEHSEETALTQSFVGCGAPAREQQVVVVHPETRTCVPSGVVGEIWVKGPSVAGGYWRNPEATAETFCAYRTDTGEGPYLRTGDLGFVHRGEVYITGRWKDIIIIRGRNYYPQDIELTVERCHPSLRPGCGAAFAVEVNNEERLVVVQEVMRNYQDPLQICQAIRQAIAEQYELQVYAVVLLCYGSIYKTSSGKIQRRACRNAFLRGELQVVASEVLEETSAASDPQQKEPLTRSALLVLTPEEQYSVLQSYLREQIAAKSQMSQSYLSLDMPVSVTGLDSLKAAELQRSLADELEITLPFTDLLSDITLSALVETIHDQLQRSVSPAKRQNIARTDRADAVYPLSSAQEQLWVLYQLEPMSAFYNIPLTLQIKGSLNIAALDYSIETIVQRHEPLRTTFDIVDGQSVQRVHTTSSVHFSVVDLRTIPTQDQRRQEAHSLARQEIQRPFDLTRNAPLRVVLLQLSEDNTIFLLTMHHICSDGWSMGLLIQELEQHYSAACAKKQSSLPALPVTYVDYALWQREWLQREEMASQLAYWKRQLDQLPVLDLLTDRPRPAVQSYRGAIQRFRLPVGLKERYQQLCAQEGVTLFMAFLSVFQFLLARYASQEEIVLGTVVANRLEPEVQKLIGFFVNTLVIRAPVTGTNTFREHLQSVRKICLEAYAHQALPFSKLVEALQPERDPSRNPLFQVMFSWQPDVLEQLDMPALQLTPFEIESTTAKFDLSIEMVESRDALSATVEYNSDLFDAETMKQMLIHFQALLEAVLLNPDLPLAQLPLMSSEAYLDIVGRKWTSSGVTEQAYLHELFERQVEQTPDALAVFFNEQCITYLELNRRANQFASLLREDGPGSQTLIGVCLHRSPELLIVLLGILKAGCAYVPLDPTYPRQRLDLMINSITLGALVTHSAIQSDLPVCTVPTLCLDQLWERIAQQPASNLLWSERADRLIYVIFTSGSTGQPKGAGVYQSGFMMLLRWFIGAFCITSQDRVLLTSAFSFDLTQKDIFVPLLVGGTLVLHASQQYEVTLVQRALLEQNITLLNWTPSAFYPLVEPAESGLPMRFPLLRHVFLGGEPISVQRLQPWLAQSSAEIVNTYGPTECTDVVAYYRLQEPERFLASTVPIGRPIWDTRLFVLDDTLHLQPIGAVGELYIAGASVGAGYINDAAQTASRFVPDPFSEQPGQRLYKTGDLVRYRSDSDSELEFCGRKDQQVKLRGYRIELREIESLLNRHAGVRESAVVVREDVPGNQRLVAYVVLAEAVSGKDAITSTLRSYLQEKLASYMLPSHIIPLDALPLTPSGKLHYQALPEPGELASEEETAPVLPRIPLEEILTALWSECLGRSRIGIHDNFFALGGHSLLGTRLISNIKSILHVTMPLRSLFEEPTIAGQARQIATKLAIERSSQRQDGPLLIPYDRNRDFPLSFSQERIWFLTQIMPDSSAYATPLPIQLQGPLSISLVQHSIEVIVKRHEILRTRIIVKQGQPVQVIIPAQTLSLPVIDLQGLPKEERTGEVERLINSDIRYPFDLAVAVFRSAILRLEAREHILLLTFHHIIFDGWSQSVLLNEFATVYEAACVGEAVSLPSLPVQYADFALWQRDWLGGDFLASELRYWTERLQGCAPLQLPTSYPRPTMMSDQGASHFFTLPFELSQALMTLSYQEGVTLFMTLLVAFQLLLSRYSGQDDIVVGTDIANRTMPETEPLIGFFVNILPMRTKFRGELQFREVLRQAREMVLGAYAYQDVPFDRVVDALQLKRTTNQLPLVNVLLVLQNLPETITRSGELTIKPLVVGVNSTKFDLALFMWEEQGRLSGAVNYSTALFEPAFMERLVVDFERLLRSITVHPAYPIDALEMCSEEEKEQRFMRGETSRETRRRKLKITKRSVMPLPDAEF
ncbi:hypothetical protein ccbrp13_33070 [Ktedonobacteria bacterium brp13]|nr:hypothetical protein ccbrp13_33070 [Ktedonobacteria bacterium brp13]